MTTIGVEKTRKANKHKEDIEIETQVDKALQSSPQDVLKLKKEQNTSSIKSEKFIAEIEQIRSNLTIDKKKLLQVPCHECQNEWDGTYPHSHQYRETGIDGK